jgi:hypothetical protein
MELVIYIFRRYEGIHRSFRVKYRHTPELGHLRFQTDAVTRKCPQVEALLFVLLIGAYTGLQSSYTYITDVNEAFVTKRNTAGLVLQKG